MRTTFYFKWCSLVTCGLSWSVDEKSLRDAFSSFGRVTKVRVLYDKNSGRSRGFGFINFSTVHEAKSTKHAMDGKAFLGQPLRISYVVVPHRERKWIQLAMSPHRIVDVWFASTLCRILTVDSKQNRIF